MKRSSRIRIQEAAKNTTGQVLPRGIPETIGDVTSQPNRAEAHEISVRTQAKLDFLARYCPDLLNDVADGKISADRAYQVARGKTGLTQRLEQIRRLWNAATPEQREQIQDWIEKHS